MLRLPAIFSDHMVLQRNKMIKVWGEADGEIITVSLEDENKNKILSITSVRVTDGKWSADMPAVNAGGPYALKVTDGDATIIYDDVMVGEVWLAGGQSNMEFELQNCKGGQELVAGASDNGVRFYYTPKVSWVGDELYSQEANASWELCSPDSCYRWSAVGYFFAKKLTEKLGVTVGVIGCNWGGTSAACWMSREALESKKSTILYVEEYDKEVAKRTEEEYLEAYRFYKEYQAEFDKNVGEYYKTNPNPTWEEAISLFGECMYPGPMGSRNECRPYGLYESMLKRVMPYTLKGFIFYQAENDDHRPYTYADLFSSLIECWRRDWLDDNLPFLFVQLPMFSDIGAPDFKNWPLLRAAQDKIFRTVKNTGMAVALDMGEYGNIHPIDKKPVGIRLASQALYQVYGLAACDEAFGPMYKDYMVDGDKLYIQLEHVYDGIKHVSHDNADYNEQNKCTNNKDSNNVQDDITANICSDNIGSIHGFELAGADKIYYPANAVLIDAEMIKSGTETLSTSVVEGAFEAHIVLCSDKVSKPMYARYCWSNYCEVELFGANGIPVAPFRTSAFDGAKATGNSRGIEM